MIEEWNKKGVLDFEIIDCQKLTGGTASQVWLLTDCHQEKYVLKSNENIQEEIDYLTEHSTLSLLPKILFTDSVKNEYLYPFMSGEVEKKMVDKQNILSTFVIKILNSYEAIESSHWGWTTEPKQSWQEFLLTEIAAIREVNSSVLTEADHQLVKKICLKKIRNPEKAYLLHGDSGVHNFLQSDGELVGVIDPEPLIGPRIHDLVSAFCSTPEDLTYEVISTAISQLEGEEWSRKKIIEEVLLGLYFRFIRCIYHHPIDLPIYLIAWENWKSKYLEEIKEEKINVFWSNFLKETNKSSDTTYLECFYFDLTKESANHLLELVLSGKKTATASSFLSYENTGERIPAPGDLSIVTDWEGVPFCVIETKSITLIPYNKITYSICRREGEDETLASWKEKHAHFFTEEGKILGYTFTDEMLVVFEDFEVSYQI